MIVILFLCCESIFFLSHHVNRNHFRYFSMQYRIPTVYQSVLVIVSYERKSYAIWSNPFPFMLMKNRFNFFLFFCFFFCSLFVFRSRSTRCAAHGFFSFKALSLRRELSMFNINASAEPITRISIYMYTYVYNIAINWYISFHSNWN